MAKRDPLAGYGRIKVAHLIPWLKMLPPDLDLPIKRAGGWSTIKMPGESALDAIHIKRSMADMKTFGDAFLAGINAAPPEERARLHKSNFPEQYTKGGIRKKALRDKEAAS